MTTDAAVLDPETKTDTQTATGDETQADPKLAIGTDDASAAAQTDTGAGDDTADDDDEAGLEARVASSRAEADQERIDAAVAKALKEQAAKATNPEDEHAFGNAMGTARNYLKQLGYMKDGEFVSLSDADHKLILDPFEKANLVGLRAHTAPLMNAVKGMIPEESHADFEKAIKPKANDQGVVSPEDYFTEAIQFLDPKVRLQGLNLEAAMKASATLRADVAAFEKKTRDTAYAKGLKAVGGTSGNGGGKGAASSGNGWKTKEDARNLHATGKLSTAEIRRINADPSIPEGYGR